ncbi:glutathione S-transferase N-terminal domain-containing protein [Sneathiella sp. CAU 1612]|uniref:Glutathione S-transferase N-terminal domain-containing protein n=1 Tax=Sneathiella sedimenti TaxID=2816034 RepID=A0ABS3F4R3_9PROT|nr:glutathione S-transferase N-terminal domain-containing protein [Sneathiella sedimenti]MBO0333384.1 glutathione S-transferase N-terminal domain-containing protein [Sneathiella sedimenti]
MYKLFYSPGTIALTPHIVLEEIGASFDAIRVNFADGEQTKPDYLKINPKGRVPALITEQGILTETPAILLYLAQKHPDAKLAPLDDVFQLGKMQSINSYLSSTAHVNHAHRRRGTRWVTEKSSIEDMGRKVKSNMEDCFALIQSEMFKGPWVMGDDYSVADPYLFTVSRWLEGDGVNIADFPKIEAHFARMMERPAVQRALALHTA